MCHGTLIILSTCIRLFSLVCDILVEFLLVSLVDLSLTDVDTQDFVEMFTQTGGELT